MNSFVLFVAASIAALSSASDNPHEDARYTYQGVSDAGEVLYVDANYSGTTHLTLEVREDGFALQEYDVECDEGVLIHTRSYIGGLNGRVLISRAGMGGGFFSDPVGDHEQAAHCEGGAPAGEPGGLTLQDAIPDAASRR